MRTERDVEENKMRMPGRIERKNGGSGNEVRLVALPLHILSQTLDLGGHSYPNMGILVDD